MKQDELTGMYYDYATQCDKYFGNMNIEGVEIDEKITDLSRKYFSLSDEIPVTTYDGRAFLNALFCAKI